MPLALLSLVLMPIRLDGFILEFLGFFIALVSDVAAYIVTLPSSVWIIGHIEPLGLLIFSLSFFWVCIWQTKWRFLGLVTMIISLFIMSISKKPDFIYDHTLKTVGIKNEKGFLEIYTESNIPKFVSNYWSSWYGQKEVKINRNEINKRDQLYTLPSGIRISLNYWQCLDSDVKIITSKKLHCKGGEQIISNKKIWENKQVILYCYQKKCKVEFGSNINYSTL